MSNTRKVLFAIIVQGFGLFACTSPGIPEGIYKLEEENNIPVEKCETAKTILGNTLILDKDSMFTSVKHEKQFLRYPVLKLKDFVYLINGIRPLTGDTIPLKFIYDAGNNQLRFCEGRINYQMKK